MTSTFHFLGEPLLEFGHGQTAEDPHDGLSLFGPAESRSQLPDNIVIGTERGIDAWKGWCEALNAPAACVDPNRHRAWPPFPGFDVAFGARWPLPIRSYAVDAGTLSEASRKADKHDRAFAVAQLYLDQAERLGGLMQGQRWPSASCRTRCTTTAAPTPRSQGTSAATPDGPATKRRS